MTALLLAVALAVADPDAACRAQCECFHAPDDGMARACTLIGGCNCARLLGLDGGIRAVPMPIGIPTLPQRVETGGPGQRMSACDYDAALDALRGLMPFLTASTDRATNTDLTYRYRTPSEELRDRADRIEREDAAIDKARAVVAACGAQP